MIRPYDQALEDMPRAERSALGGQGPGATRATSRSRGYAGRSRGPALPRFHRVGIARARSRRAGSAGGDRAPAEVVATLLDEGHYLCSERTMYRILAADQPVRERRYQREHPQYAKPELVAHGAEPDLVLGYHQAVGADEVDVLLPLRRARHLQPLRGPVDGRRAGELGAGRSSHLRELPQTGQPVLRGAVQDPEVPPRLPWRFHASTTSPPRSPSAERSSPGTTPSIAMAGSRCSPRTTCIIIEPRACWASAGAPFKPPGPVIPNASFGASQNQTPFPKRSGSTHP